MNHREDLVLHEKLTIRIKKPTIKIKSMQLFICAFIFLLYAFTVGLQDKIYPFATYSVPLFFAIGIYFLYKYAPKKGWKISSMDMMVILMICIILFFNNANIAHGSMVELVYTVAIFLFYIFGHRYLDWKPYMLGIQKYIGIFYACMTIYTVVNPAFFNNIVVPLFKDYGYMDQMSQLFKQGFITGFTPHYSTNAMYLAVCFSVPFASFIAEKKKSNLIICFLLLGSVLLTGKRAHAIFILAAVVITYYVLNSDKPLTRWGKIIIGLVIGTCILTVAAEFVPSLLNVVYRFIETYQTGSLEMGRDVQRAYALEAWSTHPIFGIGWDSFKYYFQSVRGIYINVHCVYVQLLCEVGIVGSLPFYLFFVFSLIHSIKTLKIVAIEKIQDKEIRFSLVYAVFVQVFFLLYCLTGNPLYDAPTLFTYIFGCAIGEYYYKIIVSYKMIESPIEKIK